MKKALTLLTFFVCSSAFAEDTTDPDRIMQDVAKDLSALHSELQKIYISELPLPQTYYSDLKIMKPDKFDSVMTTGDIVGIYKGAALTSGSINSVSAGTSFPIVDKVNDWYAVALDKPIEGFSTGWVRATQAVPVLKNKMIFGASVRSDTDLTQSGTERVYSLITRSVNTIRLKYEANPYVTISGFRVDMSIPPGVSVLFQFK